MSPTTFGVKAMGDRALIPNLRHGRRLHPETREKIDAFMQLERRRRESAESKGTNP